MMDPKLAELIERQKGLYSRVAELIERQEAALDQSDLAALLGILSEKQGLFEQMEQNEKAISEAVSGRTKDDELKAVLEEMAARVRILLEREEKSLGALKNLKEQAVRNAGRLQQGKRVIDAYKQPPGTDARFIDEDR